MKTYDIFDVANWFLAKESMPHKKLQKLCYYALAWGLVYFPERNPFNFKFQAWVHGPVNVDLWHELKETGGLHINNNALKYKSVAISSEDILELLDAVWETYSEFNGFQLENLTHGELPWQIARGDLEPFDPSNEYIDEDEMRNFYSSLLVKEGIGD